MMSPATEFQKLVVGTLAGNADIMAIVTDVYDYAGHTSTPPYISLGPITETPLDATGITYSEYRLQIDIWSDRKPKRECQEICHLVKKLFHNSSLTLSTHAIGTIRVTGNRMLREANGITNHGVITLTANIEEY